jgi:hypothetical protein
LARHFLVRHRRQDMIHPHYPYISWLVGRALLEHAFTRDAGSIGPDRGGAAARGGGTGRGMEDTNLSAPLAEVGSIFFAGRCR